jgi:hypothetical protein
MNTWGIWKIKEQQWLTYCGIRQTYTRKVEASAEAVFLTNGSMKGTTYEARLIERAREPKQAPKCKHSAAWCSKQTVHEVSERLEFHSNRLPPAE